jgi:hypothetical protein
MSPTTNSSWPAAKHHQISGRAGWWRRTATTMAATDDRPIRS